MSCSHRMKTSWGLYSSLKTSSKQQRSGGHCDGWKHSASGENKEREGGQETEKYQSGLQWHQNKDLVPLRGMVEVHGRHLSSKMTNHRKFWKISFRRKPFIWPPPPPSPPPLHLLCLRLPCLLLGLYVNADSSTFVQLLFWHFVTLTQVKQAGLEFLFAA